jgi:phosphodiesterase/alkaline phosphatase D-like protein
LKLAIGSCIKVQDLATQPVWNQIRAYRPDALLLLSDNVYPDTNDHRDPQALALKLPTLYQRQFAQPQFADRLDELRGRGGRLFAIFDDHDFLGDNRCGANADPALREAATAELVRACAPVQTGDEVYGLHRLGVLDLLLLDVRFHRRAAISSEAATDVDALLGAEQWLWFEAAVARSTAPYLVVASSITARSFGA